MMELTQNPVTQNILAVVLLVIGFVLLVKGADFFVEGSSSVAKKLRVPSLIIGMTIVAMGTSLPETAVSIAAAMSGQNSLAVSNVVGSNIFNLMVVLGTCALFNPLYVDKSVLKKDFPFSVVCAAILFGLGMIGMSLGRTDGIIFLAVFAVFMVFMVRGALKARKMGIETPEEKEFEEEAEEIKDLPTWKCILYIIGGIIAIKFGGDWVVDGAVTIATNVGISQTIIGLTIVAFGTSLPELVTSVVAARKNELDMAVGNVIGSNIFNILMVLGIAGAISPMAFLMLNIIDIVVLIVFSVIVWLFCITKKRLARPEGIIMLVMYAAYVVYICVR